MAETLVARAPARNLDYYTITHTFSNSYTTGGELVNMMPSNSVLVMVEQPLVTYLVVYDRTNNKLVALDGTLAEVAALTNLSSVTVRLLVFAAR